jgi:hypothetical protein
MRGCRKRWQVSGNAPLISKVSWNPGSLERLACWRADAAWAVLSLLFPLFQG